MLIDYDEEVIIRPDHLDEDFFEKIIQNALRLKDPRIVKVCCCMGSKAGENYCSFIYRAKIQYKNNENSKNIESLSVIIKSMPKSGATEFIESLDVFTKECTIYYEILPQLEMLLGENQSFGPRIYHQLENPVNTLVFEDLAILRYRVASREQGLDELHALLVLRRLAQLHASSMVLTKKRPEILKSLTTGMLAPVALKDEKGVLMQFFGTSANCMLAEVSKWPEYETILHKLEKYVSNLGENLAATQAPTSKDEIHVINHGDLWVNNMLFQYEANDQRPSNVIFVDFQMSLYGSPGIDLNYFFYTSLHLDLLKTKRTELLTHYHHELCSNLEDLGYLSLKPTLQQVLNEFDRRASHGFFAAICILPMICSDKEISEDSSLDNYLDEEFTKRKMQLMFQSTRVQNTLKYIIKEFDKLGTWN